MLTGADRRLLTLWAEHGIPDDPGTIDHAARTVLPRLWRDHLDLERSLGQLTAALDEEES